jgi:hypothetical protein
MADILLDDLGLPPALLEAPKQFTRWAQEPLLIEQNLSTPTVSLTEALTVSPKYVPAGSVRNRTPRRQAQTLRRYAVRTSEAYPEARSTSTAC